MEDSQFTTLHHVQNCPYGAMPTYRNKYTSFSKGTVHAFGRISHSGPPPICAGHIGILPISRIAFYLWDLIARCELWSAMNISVVIPQHHQACGLCV